MEENKKQQYIDLLNKVAENLDISDSLYEKIRERYSSIGHWLCREESSVRQYNPEIYTQGSIQLGTIVKPMNDEYDVDLVCELNLSKEQLTQKQLKQQVGREISKYVSSNGIKHPLKEGRRCWTIRYSDETPFHVDVLPSIPDNKYFQSLLKINNLADEWAENAIAITDKTNPYYESISFVWPLSNPKDYSSWFRKQMQTQFLFVKNQLAQKARADIRIIPDYKVKTPLQRSIQILKRHRDVMFADDLEDKPISIIITTLAAQAYGNENNVFDALQSILDKMPYFISERNGEAFIPNPVNPMENFADKWKEFPRRKENFKKWLHKVKADFECINNARDIEEFITHLSVILGEKIVFNALSDLPSLQKNNYTSYNKPNNGSSSRFNVTHRQKPLWQINIYGNVEVTAYYERNGFRPREFQSDSEGLPKNSSIHFVAQTNICRPFKVFWQVVNTGQEAFRANCPRGGYYDGVIEKGGLERRESTLYTGMHWVECFIVKDGFLVARSGEYVVNIA